VDELSRWPNGLVPYVALLKAFVSGRLSGDEFEPLFLSIFKNDRNLDRGAAFAVLERLFAAVDEYAPEDVRARIGGIGEDAMKDEARVALNALERVEGFVD